MVALKKTVDELAQFRNAYFLAFSAAMGSLCFGWDVGYIGGILALPSFQQYFGLDTESPAARATSIGNLVSILQAGGLFGAIISGWFASRYGRKPSMLLSGVIFLAGSVIQAIVGVGASPAVGLRLLYFSRFFTGIGLGFISALVPIYISECAPCAIRGRCTGSAEVALALGNMISFWVNYGVSLHIPAGEMQWRTPIIVHIIPGVLFLLLMLFQPESPRWLADRERYEEAANILAYIGRTDPSSDSVLSTLSEMRADFAGRDKLSVWMQIRKMGENRTIAFRCAIPSLLTFCWQWTGINAILFYAPQIFTSLGISNTPSSLLATGTLGIIRLVAVCVTLAFVIESWGRKRTLFYGGIAQGIMMLWIGGYAAIHPEHTLVPATYVSVVAIHLFTIFFSLGWGFTPLVLASEIAPGHLRPAVMSLAAATTWLWAYVITLVTPIMLAQIGWGTYVLFGVASVVMAIWVWAGLPETAGVHLEDVKWLFEGDYWMRCLQDAPGGRVFLGIRRVGRLEGLKKRPGGAPSEPVVPERAQSRALNGDVAQVTRPSMIIDYSRTSDAYLYAFPDTLTC